MGWMNKFGLPLILLGLLGSATPRLAADTNSKGTPSPAPLDLNSEDDLGVKTIQGKNHPLSLAVGISRTLEFPFDLGSIMIGEPSLLKYERIRENGKERKLLLAPQNSGYTEMTIFDTSNVPRITYQLRVTREDLGQLMAQLDDLLGDVEGLKIRSLGGTVILDGEILLPKDMIRIMRVIDAVKDRDPKKKEIPIRNLATISKLTMNILAERIEREINSPEIQARVINNNLFIEGTAESDFEADRAVEIAKTYLPEVFVEKGKGEGGEIKPKGAGGVGGGVPNIIDLLRVRRGQAPPPAKDIKITMNYVELNNEYSKLFDFQWKPLTSDTSTVKFDSTLGELSANVVATVSSLLPKLNTARDHQHARILKTETIIVRDKSDAPAVIDSSIKMYAPVVNPQGQTTLQEIPIQNQTKVKAATIAGSDSIDMGVQITLSAPVGLTQGTPTISTNSLQTQITIKNGDSAALGGYAIDQALAGYNREPAQPSAAQTPGSPLFNFTRSKNYQHNKQQYVIFITPEVIQTAASATEDITKKFRLNAGER